MSRYHIKEPKTSLYPTEEISMKVYKAFTEKGKEMKRSGAFSVPVWTDYVLSVGCEFTDQNFVLDSEREIIVRDEHYFYLTQPGDRKVWGRLIKVDFETAMKIATLGLP